MADREERRFRIIEEHGTRYALVPVDDLRALLERIEDLQDALDLRQAIDEGGEFITLSDLDAELRKAGLL